MKKYILFAIQTILTLLIIALDIIGIISGSAISVLFIIVFFILIFDLAYEAILSTINLRFFDSSIYITIASISLIFISGIKEALISLLIIRIFRFILELFNTSSETKIFKLLRKLLPKDCDTLKPGDNIILKPFELLPTDSVLLDSCALFSPVFSSPGTKPTEYLQGDDIPGGFRLISEEPVNLHVTTHYSESTFVKYIHTFKKSIENAKRNDETVTLLPIVLIILGLISTIVCLISPKVTAYSAFLVFITCCIFLPTANITGFYTKLLFYFFQKGILPADNIRKILKTKTFFISKSAIIKPGEYSVTDVCPAKKASISPKMLLTYAAQAEIPYAHTGIGKTILKEAGENVLLSAVTHTENQPGLGIITQYKKNTIHAGCKEFMQSSKIKKLPAFSDIENNDDINDIFIYVALNGNYVGFIRLHAILKNSYSDFLDYTRKHRIATTVTMYNSEEECDTLIEIKRYFQKKCRTPQVAYIDSKPSDSAIQSMSDYNIFLGFSAYCPENDFTDVTIIPNSFKALLRTIKLSKKICFNVKFYITIFIIIKLLLIVSGFIIPDFKIWYALLAEGIICTILIKIYDIFFRLFTSLN